jgi:hypothetical protein
MTALNIAFELTEAEAEIAGARAAWRLWLARGLGARHVAPLAGFALAITAIAALGLSGGVTRRTAEMSLILAAAAFMALQLWTQRGLAAARQQGAAIGGALRSAGLVRLTLDEDSFTFGAPPSVLRFADGLEIEATADLIYVWPRVGAPLVWPRRAHETPEDAEAFLTFARARAV